MAIEARRVTVTDEPTLISGTPDRSASRHGVEWRVVTEGEAIEWGGADVEFGEGFPWSYDDGVHPITTGNAVFGIADTGLEIEVAVVDVEES